MDNTKEKILNKNVLINSLKLFAKTLVCLIFIFFFVISSLFVLAPKFDAKIFSFFGLKKAEEACYERVYDKSNSCADLYNLIVFESELENYEKELYYINLLNCREDYDEFCNKLDNSALQTINDKSLVAYTCNTNAYLINQKIKSMYKLGFDSGVSPTVRNFVKAKLESEELFDSAYATYVEMVCADNNLTNSQKIEKLNLIKNICSDLVSTRLNNLQNFKKGKITVAEAIIAQNTIVNINKANYLIEKENQSEDLELAKTAYEFSLEEYNALIK